MSAKNTRVFGWSEPKEQKLYNVEDIKVRKTRDIFSFIKTFCSLVNNTEFKNGQLNALNSYDTTANSYIWSTLSAIGEEVGNEFYERIRHYIDDISNIELCKVYSLESLVKLLGIDYTVFNTIHSFPLEIQNLLDVLSIKREYLNKLFVVDETLATTVNKLLNTKLDDYSLSTVKAVNDERYNYMANKQNLTDTEISAISTDYNVFLTVSQYIDSNKLDELILDIYKYTLLNAVNQTYNDINISSYTFNPNLETSANLSNYSNYYSLITVDKNTNISTLTLELPGTLIREYLSSTILLSNFILPNSIAGEVAEYKILNNINPKFNLEYEADRVENLEVALSSFGTHEQYLLSLEFNRRKEPFDNSLLETRYKYYREKSVKTYFDFIVNQFYALSAPYVSADVYSVDEQYIIINDDNQILKQSLLNADGSLKYEYIDIVADLLLEITNLIRTIREQLKTLSQRNFMKGSFVLINYLINEYLKTTVYKNLTKLGYLDKDITEYSNYSNIIEYIDTTEYYNISTYIDQYLDNHENPLVTAKNIDTSTINLTVSDTIKLNFTTEELNLPFSELLSTTLSSNRLEYLTLILNNISSTVTVNAILSSTLNELLSENLSSDFSKAINVDLETDINVFYKLLKTAEIDNDFILSTFFKEKGLNRRYWLSGNAVPAIGPIDSTNIFLKLPIINSYSYSFNSDDIENFYINVLLNKFKFLSNEIGVHTEYLVSGNISVEAYISSVGSAPITDPYEITQYKNKCHFYDFLSEIFDIGADITRRDKNGNIVVSSAVDPTSKLYLSKIDQYIQYSGLCTGVYPYENLKNTVYSLYQIHPYLSNFVEYSTCTYAIENVINVVNENIEELILEEGLSNCFDVDGYTINIWRNPLNSNTDYLTRYETATHIDSNNNVNKQYGYDGLFYPNAILSFLLACSDLDNPSYVTFLSNVVNDDNNNIYNGYNITQNDRLHISALLDFFKDELRKVATEKYLDIYRFGIDLYGNQYLLLKDYNLTSYDLLISVDIDIKKTTPGILWVKRKNHPIAFPAYVIDNETKNNNYSYSLIYADKDTNENSNSNSNIFSSKYVLLTTFFDGNLSTQYSTPAIYDFCFSKDKSEIIINTAAEYNKTNYIWPFVAFPNVQMNKVLLRQVLILEKNKTDTGVFEDAWFLNNYKKISGFKFGTYYNNDTILGAMFYKVIGTATAAKQILLMWFEYDRDNETETHTFGEQTLITETAILDKIVTIDSYNDTSILNSNTVKFTISYLTKSEITKNSYAKTYARSSDLTQGLEINILNVLTANPVNVQIEKRIESIELTLFANRLINRYNSSYMQYIDEGFNPIYGIDAIKSLTMDINDFSKTALPTYLQSHGIAKFELLHANVDTPMDYTDVIPVRLYENYNVISIASYGCNTNNNATHVIHNISAADMLCIHFEDSIEMLSATKINNIGNIYKIRDFNDVYNKFDLTMRIDEAYRHFIDTELYVDGEDKYFIDKYSQYNLYFTNPDNKIPGLFLSARPDQNDITSYSGDKAVFSLMTGINISCSSHLHDNIGYLLDFNTANYLVPTDITAQRPDDPEAKINLLNRKHLFLSLREPGDIGYLLIWDKETYTTLCATYYIKNISDTLHPRFIISADYNKEFYDDPFKITEYFHTEDDTTCNSIKFGNEQIVVLSNGIEYELIAEK